MPNVLIKCKLKMQFHVLRKRDLRKEGHSMVGKTKLPSWCRPPWSPHILEEESI